MKATTIKYTHDMAALKPKSNVLNAVWEMSVLILLLLNESIME
jgi:hypothetical protein